MRVKGKNRKGEFFVLKLKELRKKKNITQEEIAEKIGLSQSSIQRIENNKQVLNHNQIISLCKVLDVRADELLGLDDTKDPE